MRNDYKIILDLIPENSKVLDIGCSDGDLIALLADKNISAQGVELKPRKSHFLSWTGIRCHSWGYKLNRGGFSI